MGLAQITRRQELQAAADSILQSYLVSEPDHAESILHTLISDHAEPLIEEVVSSRLRGRFSEDRTDLRNDVVLLALARLRALRESPDTGEIRHFRDYVAVLAYHECSHYYRKKFPLRQAFKSRLRYVLTHDP